MKVRNLMAWNDLAEGKLRNTKDEEYEMSKERFEAVNKAGFGKILEEVKADQTREAQTKIQTPEDKKKTVTRSKK